MDFLVCMKMFMRVEMLYCKIDKKLVEIGENVGFLVIFVFLIFL